MISYMYSIVRKSSKIKGTELYPLMLLIRVRLSSNKYKKKEITLKLPPVLISQWDPDTPKYKRNAANAKINNLAIDEIMKRCEAIEASLIGAPPLEYINSFAFKYKNFYKPAASLPTVTFVLNEMVNSKKRNGQFKTAHNYNSTKEKWGSFLKHIGREAITMEKLSLSNIEEFASYCKSVGRGMGNSKRCLVDIRGSFKYAQRYEIIDRAIPSPFEHFNWKSVKSPTSSAKVSLEIEEWEQFKAYTPRTKKEEYYKDLFLSLVYCHGINLKDFMFIKKDDILTINDEGKEYKMFKFIRSKTKKEVTVVMEESMLEIIEKYKDESPYLMPILKRFNIKEKERTEKWEIKYGRKRLLVNTNLKKLAENAGIPDNISLYTARHTFASILYFKNVDIRFISSALGHQTVSQTQTYLAEIHPTITHKNITGIL